MLYPMILKPVLKEYLWGGTNLRVKYGKETKKETIAESWELSCHKEGVSVIANGKLAGTRLDDFIHESSGNVLGTNVKLCELPVLVKLIDAADNLSIQVHPDDCYAEKHENQPGKKEMWYIIDCEPDASLFFGFKNKIDRGEFVHRAEDGSITEVLNRVNVSPGDVFFIDAGVVHAIGKGITVAEIGSNCNITYRLFDFFRKDSFGNPRELHIKKAAEVVHLDIPEKQSFNENGLLDCKDFIVQEIKLKTTKKLTADLDSFHSLLCVHGNCAIEYNGESVEMQKGTSVFVPAGMGSYALNGEAVLLKTTV
jgi:Phosphomannose isomerase